MPDLTVVLCHGFGAPGDDLVPLAGAIVQGRPELGGRVRFVFPEAPLVLSQMGMPYGRAWWEIDLDRISAARDAESMRRLSQQTPEGLGRARRALLGLVDELARQSGGAASRMVLGGFSQGGMIVTDVALRLEEAPAGLLIFSGTLICEPEWRRRAPARRGLKVLQSHGTQDPLLPFERALALRDLLIEAGLEVDFLPFEGVHTIVLEALERTADLIVGCLPPR